MSEITSTSAPEWYRQNSPIYDGLSGVVAATVSNLLKSQKIDFLAVSARTKTLDSLIEKIEKKGYQATEDITDIVGVRIITYIESDVKRACDIIESAFQVHREKSGDKSAALQSNEIGYRSVHYVCDLGTTRVTLPELAQFSNMLFEVQVRTVLQHAWAEIEHDRSYKFAGELPAHIKRRLNLLAGTLEIIDREFDTLAKEVDAHSKEAKEVAQSGHLNGVPLTSAGLAEFLLNSKEISKLPGFNIELEPLSVGVFTELRAYGIDTLADFSNLISKDFIDNYKKYQKTWSNTTAFCRSAMMYQDIDRYFTMQTDRKVTGITLGLANLLEAKYGQEKILEIQRFYGISRVETIGKRIVRRPPPPERKI